MWQSTSPLRQIRNLPEEVVKKIEEEFPMGEIVRSRSCRDRTPQDGADSHTGLSVGRES